MLAVFCLLIYKFETFVVYLYTTALVHKNCTLLVINSESQCNEQYKKIICSWAINSLMADPDPRQFDHDCTAVIHPKQNLGNFKCSEHNLESQPGLPTRLITVIFSYSKNQWSTTCYRIIICTSLSTLSYLGTHSTGFYFMRESSVFIPYVVIW